MKRTERLGELDEAAKSAKAARLDEFQLYQRWLQTPSDSDQVEQGVKDAILKCEARFVPVDTTRFLNAQELAITRVLQANSVIRARFGVTPFFPEDADVGYLNVMSDATEVDTSSAATQPVTFVRSWMNVGQQSMSRHAMTLLRATAQDAGNQQATPVLFLVDSNGRYGSHALRFEHLQHSPVPIRVLDTRGVQVGVQDTTLWKSGQVLGKFMGWCSLWTMCLCELVAVGGLSIDGVRRLMSPQTEEELMRLLVVVRQSSIRMFHHAVRWLDRNNYTQSLQFRLLNPYKFPANSETSNAMAAFGSIKILGETLAVEIDEDHVLIGACKKRRSLDVATHGYSVFVRWEIVNGPLLFTIGLAVALEDLTSLISEIRKAIETFFDTKLPPYRERGENGRRLWVLDDYAVYVPKLLQAESRAVENVREKLKDKLREMYKGTNPPWLEASNIKPRARTLLNIDLEGRAFVFNDNFDLRVTTSEEDAKAGRDDPQILYKKSLSKTFPLWKKETAEAMKLDDIAIKLVVKTDKTKKVSSQSFGVRRDFNRSDVQTLIRLIQNLRSMDNLTNALTHQFVERSLTITIASKMGVNTVEQGSDATSPWRWDRTEDLLFDLLKQAV